MKKIAKESLLLIALPILALSLLIPVIYDYNNSISGKKKFNQAMEEVYKTHKNNACLGSSVLKKYKYQELNKKSVEEIESIILQDPGSC